MAVYQYIGYINLCQKVVKSMITWKTINILYFKDAVNFGLQMSLVTDWKVKLNKHPNNISALHLLLTCQAFFRLCVRTSVLHTWGVRLSTGLLLAVYLCIAPAVGSMTLDTHLAGKRGQLSSSCSDLVDLKRAHIRSLELKIRNMNINPTMF